MNTRTLLALAAFGLAAAVPAQAQQTVTYLPNSATINYNVGTDSAIVGYANQSDYVIGRNPTNPTINFVSGGAVNGNLIATNGSTVNFSGGSANVVNPIDNSAISITSGSFGAVSTNGNSTTTITGGSFSGGLNAYVTSKIAISGGTFGSALEAYNSTSVTIRGGSFGQTRYYNFVDLTNGGFTFVGTGLSFTDAGHDSMFNGEDYRLMGTLQDGQSLNNKIIVVGASASMFKFAAAPEPSAVAGLALGALALCGLTLRARKTQKETNS